MELKLVFLMLLVQNTALLIVPYGIETKYISMKFKMWDGLLIVPYGIETRMDRYGYGNTRPFNRTLWN